MAGRDGEPFAHLPGGRTSCRHGNAASHCCTDHAAADTATDRGTDTAAHTAAAGADATADRATDATTN